MASGVLLKAYRRFLSDDRAEIERLYRLAMAAAQDRRTEVTITSTRFEGEDTEGQISGDPVELMAVFETLLEELDGKSQGSADHAIHFDRSKRFVQT